MTTQHTPYDAHIAQLEQAHGETADTMPIIAGVAAERRGYLAAKQEDAPLLAAAEAALLALKDIVGAMDNGDPYTAQEMANFDVWEILEPAITAAGGK